MIIENNAGGHVFRDRTCIRCKMTKDKFAESGRPDCKGAPHEKSNHGKVAIMVRDDGGAA